jgi:hypothetical protein
MIRVPYLGQGLEFAVPVLDLGRVGGRLTGRRLLGQSVRLGAHGLHHVFIRHHVLVQALEHTTTQWKYSL